ncbi:MAG: hypothetical protein HC771_19175 [Synechococcales cyanobacterium CRU_2_2]|nr:hypothetical protein [Synechococcales cyanobacterium CRU_2_2]
MFTSIRIGTLIIYLSNLCYARELPNGRIILFMTCVSLQVDGADALALKDYLHRHSADILPLRRKTEPELPPVSVHTRTTLFMPPTGGIS